MRAVSFLVVVVVAWAAGAQPAEREPAYGEPFILQPSHPKYYDLFGRTAATNGSHLAVTAGHNLGRVHVFQRAQQGAWNEWFKVAAPSGASGFGRILALASETLVVSCDDGTAWVYALKPSSSPVKLDMGGGIEGIAVTDDMVVLTGRGRAPRVWTRKNGAWRLSQELRPPDGVGVASFGGGAARHGKTLVVGALQYNGRAKQQGGMIVYRLRQGEWQPEQLLTADDGGEDHFMGLTVAVFGDVAAVTAGHGRGFVYVYRWQKKLGWRQVAKLVAPQEVLPMHFASVTMPDDHTIIHSGSTAGTFVYRRVQTDTWALKQSLPKTNAGWRASSSGRVLVVPSANSTVDDVTLAGSVYLFERG